MKKFTLLVALAGLFFSAFGQQPYTTLFETSDGTETPEYEAVIAYYQNLADDFEEVQLTSMGTTDSGKPLHLVIMDQKGNFDPESWQAEGRLVVFVNNGIHPGEPVGIDASMMYLRDILQGKENWDEDMVLALIPVYNIGGHLNRNSTTRVNQEGPKAHGFRGNARNYDLNRDFIKTDTKNSESFQEIFQWLQPHVFIDTHTSNGADYQHIMTLIETQHNMLGGAAGKYMHETLTPGLFSQMKERGSSLVPYVNVWGDVPENGWSQFKDSPRYSSGYASLFHTISYVPEAHMLKTYRQRVESMYKLFQSYTAIFERDQKEIVAAVKADREAAKSQETFDFNYQSVRENPATIDFLGYESGHKPSDISGEPRLFYDRNKPFEAEVDFYDTYSPSISIEKPTYYVIPQGWFKVVENLRRNHVHMKAVKADTTLDVTTYYITEFETLQKPYEGHYLHSDIQVREVPQQVSLRAGDWLVPMNQSSNGFIMEVLEPQGEDSYFAWNYFDTILQSKEGYSAYVFEDLAADYLAQNPGLREALEEEKAKNPDFADNGAAQLRWVYEHSPWKEKEYMRYPIFRIN
ncbi:M14 family zinc carboxypeptidase [Echinicola vietnamensis]|uniref:Zinc carboxypeptidase n=1 Tax=Echinicola vietnamensis (strain DSM 17526 / LMG 23754 / KMM 6221) TaxID=926556 RepID=L0FU89_ECHVK|nr:M14 family zinc carboxypeptidase [Echinicola vietnamensis]AGA77464.1 Zinc carboxypeptidase [Echinicola vietnamensis DSM 17526]